MRRSRHRSAIGLVDSFTISQEYCWAFRASRDSFMAARMQARAGMAGKRAVMLGEVARLLPEGLDMLTKGMPLRISSNVVSVSQL